LRQRKYSQQESGNIEIFIGRFEAIGKNPQAEKAGERQREEIARILTLKYPPEGTS